MATNTENTVLMNATSMTDSTMTDNQFNREMKYQASMNLFHSMLDNGLLTKEQYDVIDTKMKAKYKPLLATLFATDSLT